MGIFDQKCAENTANGALLGKQSPVRVCNWCSRLLSRPAFQGYDLINQLLQGYVPFSARFLMIRLEMGDYAPESETANVEEGNEMAIHVPLTPNRTCIYQVHSYSIRRTVTARIIYYLFVCLCR